MLELTGTQLMVRVCLDVLHSNVTIFVFINVHARYGSGIKLSRLLLVWPYFFCFPFILVDTMIATATTYKIMSSLYFCMAIKTHTHKKTIILNFDSITCAFLPDV